MGWFMRVEGIGLVAAALLLPLLAGQPVLAEKKKQPGLFDFETWKTPAARQRDAAQHIAPGTFDLAPAVPPARPMRTMRLRIYADRDYQGMVVHWQAKAKAQIERVNRVLQAVLRARFEIESMRSWDRSHVGQPFDTMLDEIDKLDPARDVDWVMGLVTPFRGLATSIEQIGGARLLSRHFVLRGMDSAEEGVALERELDLLSPEERQRLYADRKTHKEIVIFLHEWAHTMGALHHEDRAVIMNPIYDPRQSSFSDFEKRLLALVLDRRLDKRDDPYPESEALAELLKEAAGGAGGRPAAADPAFKDEGSDKERAALLGLAAARAAGSTAGAGVAAGPRLDIPAADATVWNQVAADINDGHLEEAWNKLAPLARKHPRQAAVAALGCWLVGGDGPHAAAARPLCDAAMALAPTDARPALDAAAAHLRAGDRGARAAPLVLAAAARRAAAAPAQSTDGELELRVARAAIAVGAPTTAEAALERLGRDARDYWPVAREVDALRRRLALPPRGAAARGLTKAGDLVKAGGAMVPATGSAGAGTGGPPAGTPAIAARDEPAYASAFIEAAEALGPAKQAAALGRELGREKVRAFADAYPGTAGADLLSCEVELRTRRAAAAAKLCEAALAKYPDISRAHYLLGFISTGMRKDAAAEKHLKRAIQLDPTFPGAWSELARLYRAAGSRDRLAQLRTQHQTLLSRPLPE
jgi:tetratricopeptide (TPR) repeat protein